MKGAPVVPSMKTTCLLIVDVQNALIAEGPDDETAFLDRLHTLLAAARRAGIFVVHVQHADPPGEPLEPGSPGWSLAEAVLPQPGEPVFSKKFNSSFKDTPLEAWLEDHGIETLITVGMQTEHCIDATIKSAFEKGYGVIVAEGTHTTFANGELTATQVKSFYQNRIWKDRYARVEPFENVVEDFLK